MVIPQYGVVACDKVRSRQTVCDVENATTKLDTISYKKVARSLEIWKIKSQPYLQYIKQQK